MKCMNIVRLNILSSEEQSLPSILKSKIDRPLYRRCGKCFACHCTTRAEWAFRASQELDFISKKGMTAFVTLTYSNKNLPTIFDILCVGLSGEQQVRCMQIRNELIAFQTSLPILQRKFDFSILVRDHLSYFIKAFNKCYKEIRCDGVHFVKNCREYYDKSKCKVRKRRYWEPSDYYLKTYRFINARVYATGEYGTFSHRCHFHVLFFLPFRIDDSDFRKIVEKNWIYGAVDVDFNIGNGAISYVAKHQIKEDFGNPQQSKIAPLVRYVSVYQGGIGVTGINDENYSRYLSVDEVGNFDKRFFQVASNDPSKQFFVSMPRYYLNHFWDRYCDYLSRQKERTSQELLDISRISEEIFDNFLVENDLYNKFVDENFLKSESEIPDFLYFIQQYGLEYSKRKRSDHFKKVFQQKKLKITRSLFNRMGFVRKEVID